MSIGRVTASLLPEVERLSERVIRILGHNPGKFTLQGTNTYVVGKGPRRILVDTGEGVPKWKETLQKVLSSENATISDVIITHWHHDHVGGVADVLSIEPKALVRQYDPSGQNATRLVDGERLRVEGATLRVVHCPGHTTDHIALVLEEEDAMFTGDNVLGEGTSVFEDLKEYVHSLGLMEKTFGGKAYPGHGPVVLDGPGRIAEYIRHRQQREDQVVQTLKALSLKHPQGCVPMDIVKVVYADVPESLHYAAERGVVQVLEKLEAERVVRLDAQTKRYKLVGDDQSHGML